MRHTLLALALALVAVACHKESSGDSKPATDPAPSAAKTAALPAEPVAAEPASAEGDSACSAPVEGEKPHQCGDNMGGCNQWDEQAAAVAKREVPANAVWKTFKVTGMHCGGCERRVIAHVGKIDGVVGVEANAELGQVRVATAADAAKAFDRATETINELGYHVEAAE